MVAVTAYERMHSRGGSIAGAPSIPLNPCVQLISKSFQERLAYSNECLLLVNTFCAKINVTYILMVIVIVSNGSTAHLLGLDCLFNFLILYTVGRDPWMRDQIIKYNNFLILS
jgi:hypothetical protein